MASSWQFACTKAARDQLASIHLKYRGDVTARAESKILSALEKNPTGGSPLSAVRFTVTVHPVQAIYEIRGNVVTIIEFLDSAPLADWD